MLIMIKRCRICKGGNLYKIIDLGQQKNTSIFPKYCDLNKVETYNINLLLCKECGLVQLEETTPPDLMYKSGNYGYKSSISNTMRNHLKKYNEEILSKKEITPKSIVLDVGSNDATFLKYYKNNIRRIGVDPTGEQFKEYYTDIELLPEYFTKDNVINRFGNIKCSIITSICMFYDLPDPVQFARDIYDLLEDDGIWTCEQSYLLTMLKTNSIDTICHEHLEYYGLTQIVEIAKRANLKIIDVKFNSSNGGSFRVYFCRKGSNIYNECTDLIKEILNNENKMDIKNPQIYTDFISSCDKELKKLKTMLRTINENNKKAYILGASTKGNCVLQYANITSNDVKYAVERNPNKIGHCTSTGIEIIDEEKMRNNPPDYLIVLPWHFKNEIIERESKFLNNGGQFIFYFPTFEIISAKPKTLITGCDGFIGNYVKKEFSHHNLYGITKTKKYTENNILKSFLNMNNYEELKNIIETINPDNIIHLASISSSIDAFNNPFETLQNNGMLCGKLCEIIFNFNKNIKLFNASSSEIYKGHINYKVEENKKSINNTNHLHPYSIAKIMSNQIIQFYRNNYNLNFSNGIVFTTQSKNKSEKFLLNKISKHIKNFKTENKNMLTVGSLESYRNIIHPIDVASAIRVILNQEIGDDYCICNYESSKILDLVLKMYKNNNINLQNNDNVYCNEEGTSVLCIKKSNDGLDTTEINIQGYPNKLLELNWKPKYSVENILNELV